MAATTASTARVIAGISRATAPATWRSSALTISRMRAVGSASMPSEAGLTCSVRRFSSICAGVFSGNAGLPHHGAGCFETQPRALFGRHVLEAAAEDLHAEGVLVADFVERHQECVQVDDALAGHEPLVVADLIGRQFGRVAEVHVDDAVLAGFDDVGGGRAGVVPVPHV